MRPRAGRPAPVTGSVGSAIRRDMVSFWRGERADIEAARPVLPTIGEAMVAASADEWV
jgi:hypothetical protein